MMEINCTATAMSIVDDDAKLTFMDLATANSGAQRDGDKGTLGLIETTIDVR